MTAYQSLIAELKQLGLLGSIGSILGWDERTQLPHKAAPLRADQSAWLACEVHERFTSNKIGDLLNAADGEAPKDDPHGDVATNIRLTRRAYDRAKKLPKTLVEELTRTAVLAEHAWIDARKQSDFPAFAPWLVKIVDLKKQEAACVGYKGHIYNALLDQFEPDETAEHLTQVFATLRGPLVELVQQIAQSGRVAPVEILERHYPAALQEKFARHAAEKIGFDFAAGRLDVSAHPFCSGIGPGDTRMTTRYDERYFGDAFFGVLHESGHGLYNQGLPDEHAFTPCGEAISLGIHESQSRLWENFVGRSRAFWKFFLPQARQTFPDALAGVSDEQWIFAINDVRPSFIRVESDEATYNLHILLRFELEQALLTGDLAVNDLPAAWDDRMQKYLGLTPPDAARGCLQDIHWAGGAIGYFPTYTLGNLYAAQFFAQADKDLGGLDPHFERGDFHPLLDWLRKDIHSVGQRYTASELVQKVTGKPLTADALLAHLRRKAGELYGLS